MIDEEVVRIIRKAQRTAKLILKEKVNILHRMAEELLKYETIDKRDIKKILDGKTIVRRNNKKSTQTRKKSHLKSSIRPKTKSTS